MSLLDDLVAHPRLNIRCPNCEETFSIRKARLFDATKPVPSYAARHLDSVRESIKRERGDLARRRKSAREVPARTAEAVRIGKVVEKIAPSLPGFPLQSRDCRALFEPIDYVAFKGLADRGIVDAIVFIDLKSGDATLQRHQRQIKGAVLQRNISFLTM